MAKFYASKDAGISEREVRNAKRSKELAAEGMVLLKNEGCLPIEVKNKNIALYGNGARHTIKGGTGSGDVNSRAVLSVEEALFKAGAKITTTAWLDRYDEAVKKAQEEYYGKLRVRMASEGMQVIIDMVNHPFQNPPVKPADAQELEAADADTAIYVLSRNSGEGGDRRPAEGDYRLYPGEKALLEQITKTYGQVIVILNVGGVIDTNYFRGNETIKAVLLMSQAGVNGSEALVEILTGAVTPSGHLTATWAENYEDYPNAAAFGHMNGDTSDEYYTEGIYVGYRYFDSFHVTPNYPFGYGLSYTEFTVVPVAVHADADAVCVTVRVTNTGDIYVGREVVQVYYSAPQGALEKPYQELAAYGKTKELAPGETQELTLSFATADMASYDETQAAWLLESGDYIVRVGTHSRATRIAARLVLSDTVAVRTGCSRLPLDCRCEVMSAKGISPYGYPEEAEELRDAKVIPLCAEDIKCETIPDWSIPQELSDERSDELLTAEDVKNKKASPEELVAQLTAAELAEVCVGTARGGWGGESVIGAASNAVPGAAGDTTSILLKDRGVRNLILADGPAGLRLSQKFAADKEDNLIPGTQGIPVPGLEHVLAEKMPKANIPDDAHWYYQYCTAIPIATLLAQTWDLEAVEAAGDLVGEEMEEFGVHLWLAPGMNIQRNPLCGRNFEYYSEDPLVAGRCAAADTKGVQKHLGCGTTIKHFACNNQEDNRMHTNAHVPERALREIYLKGFEIAVKQAQPKSIMTSYNLLNGIHTANRYDLITEIARGEWGFHGVVMTDWGTTGGIMADSLIEDGKQKYGCSSAAGCIKAGNDLIMPGRQEDVDDIIRAVGAAAGAADVSCPLTLGELQSCALHVLCAVMELG